MTNINWSFMPCYRELTKILRWLRYSVTVVSVKEGNRPYIIVSA